MSSTKTIPAIRDSAQARLLLYRLISLKLADAEQKLFQANFSQWEQLIALLENLIENSKQAKTDEMVLRNAFSQIERTAKEGLQKQIERLTGQSFWLGVFPSGLLESFVDEHQRLIKSVQRDQLDKIALAIKRGIREGRLVKDIAIDIRNVTDISKHRARLIARNAPLQYSGVLAKHYQTSANITQYRWQTSHDERVRESHRKLDGKVF